MTMIEWAEREIATACKIENPNWDGNSFDYGCSCYQSALKAYNSLMSDGHSGFSFSVTRNILKKLLDNIPLSPITDDDFFTNDVDIIKESPEYLKERGLKSDIQCPRRSSLFREEDLKGNVKYTDIDRYYCINAESPSDTFSSGTANFIDELYPITMPYIPSPTPFKVYVKYWSTDTEHGDYDIDMIIGYEDQKGQWHDYKKCTYYSYDDKETHEVTDNETLNYLIEHRRYSVESAAADTIIAIIKDYFTSYSLYKSNKHRYEGIQDMFCNNIAISVCIERYKKMIEDSCHCLAKEDEHGVCRLNTSQNYKIVINGSDEDRTILIKECEDVKHLIEIIDKFKDEIKNIIKWNQKN